MRMAAGPNGSTSWRSSKNSLAGIRQYTLPADIPCKTAQIKSLVFEDKSIFSFEILNKLKNLERQQKHGLQGAELGRHGYGYEKKLEEQNRVPATKKKLTWILLWKGVVSQMLHIQNILDVWSKDLTDLSSNTVATRLAHNPWHLLAFESCGVLHLSACERYRMNWEHAKGFVSWGNLGRSSLFNRFVRMEKRWWLE